MFGYRKLLFFNMMFYIFIELYNELCVIYVLIVFMSKNIGLVNVSILVDFVLEVMIELIFVVGEIIDSVVNFDVRSFLLGN